MPENPKRPLPERIQVRRDNVGKLLHTLLPDMARWKNVNSQTVSATDLSEYCRFIVLRDSIRTLQSTCQANVSRLVWIATGVSEFKPLLSVSNEALFLYTRFSSEEGEIEKQGHHAITEFLDLLLRGKNGTMALPSGRPTYDQAKAYATEHHQKFDDEDSLFQYKVLNVPAPDLEGVWIRYWFPYHQKQEPSPDTQPEIQLAILAIADDQKPPESTKRRGKKK